MSHKFRSMFAAAAAVAGMALTPAIASATTTLSAPYEMPQGTSVAASSNSPIHLAMQTDGNLVLYNGGTAMWQSHTYNHPNSHAAFQTDGNLVVYDSSNHPLWWSGSNGNSNATLAVQDDGNLVIYAGGRAVWATMTNAPAGGTTSGSNGPYPFPNASIANDALGVRNGTWEGQCIVFVEKMIVQAGGPSLAFPDPTSTYQAQWARHATPVGSISEAKPGDIIQWGGAAGGFSELHTAIVTSSGSDPGLIDSNFGLPLQNQVVSRGDFNSRNLSGDYRIWRLGAVQ